MFKRMPRLFKRSFDGVGNGAKRIGKSASKTWRELRNVAPETWQKTYTASKGLMWIRFAVHTVPEKGPDFTIGVADDAGKFLLKIFETILAAGGEFVKSAVREVLSGTAIGSGKITVKICQCIVAIVLLWLAFKVLLPRRIVVKSA